MPLSAQEITLIRESHTALQDQVEEASTLFYQKLFEIAPELRPMFRGDMSDQGMKLMTAIGMIVRLLEDPEGLGERLTKLGQGHAALGVKSAHFKPFGAALILTLEEVLGDDLTIEARSAWEHAYGEIAAGILGAGAGDTPGALSA